jgi:hypothetical protein
MGSSKRLPSACRILLTPFLGLGIAVNPHVQLWAPFPRDVLDVCARLLLAPSILRRQDRQYLNVRGIECKVPMRLAEAFFH